MRTDHIQKLNVACGNLAKLAEAVASEHRAQIQVMERMLRFAEAAAVKSPAPTAAFEAATESISVADNSGARGYREALDAVVKAVEGDS